MSCRSTTRTSPTSTRTCTGIRDGAFWRRRASTRRYPEPAPGLHLELQVRSRLLHQVVPRRSRRQAVAGAAVRRARQRRRLHHPLRSLSRQQRISAMSLFGHRHRKPQNRPGPSAERARRSTSRPWGRQPGSLLPRCSAGWESRPAHAAFRRAHARTGRQVHHRRRVLSGQGDGGRFPARHRAARLRSRNAPLSSCPRRMAPAASASTRRFCARFCSDAGYGGRADALAQQQEWLRRPGRNLPRRSCATAWRALVRCGHCCARRCIETRPYETTPGAADRAYQESMDDMCNDHREQLRRCRLPARTRWWKR